MNLAFTTSRRDILALTAFTYLRNPWTYAALAAFVAVTLPSTIQATDPEFGVAVNAFVVVVFELMLTAVVVLFSAILTGIIALASARHSLVEHRMTITADALTAETETDSTIVRWPGIHRVNRTDDYIFVYTQPLAAFPIPRRAVTTDSEWSTLYATISDYWHTAHD